MSAVQAERIFVAGHRGMAGSAIVRTLLTQGVEARNIVTRTHAELAQTVARVVGHSGPVTYDTGRPNGASRKLMDSGRLHGLGWRATVGLEDGLRRAYQDVLEKKAVER